MDVAKDAVSRPPYEAYAAITGVFAGGLAGSPADSPSYWDVTRVRTRGSISPPSRLRPSKVARTIARDEVTSFIREPFVERDARSGEEERPVQTGDMGQAIGELVTCSRCVGTWAAAELATTQVLAPRFGRLLTWTLAGAGINDFLQAGFAALTHNANDFEQRAEA